MRYCGGCGASLTPITLAGGTCPACGAAIGPNGDLMARGTPAEAFAVVRGHPSVHTVPAVPRQRSVTAFKVMAAMLVVAVLSGTLALLAAHRGWRDTARLHGTPPALGGAGGIGVRLHPSPGSTSSPLSYSTGTPPVTSVTTATVGPSSTPSATPAATVTGTPSSQPTLAVGPPTDARCIAGSVSFTVANAGGGTLYWTATTPGSLMLVDPRTGILTAGERQTLTVTNLALGGQITITAPGAANSPQTVHIQCKGLL